MSTKHTPDSVPSLVEVITNLVSDDALLNFDAGHAYIALTVAEYHVLVDGAAILIAAAADGTAKQRPLYPGPFRPPVVAMGFDS